MLRANTFGPEAVEENKSSNPSAYPALRKQLFPRDVNNSKIFDHSMTPHQHAFVRRIAESIPALCKPIEEGHQKTKLLVGLKRIAGKRVRLSIVAEVNDDTVATEPAGTVDHVLTHPDRPRP